MKQKLFFDFDHFLSMGEKQIFLLFLTRGKYPLPKNSNFIFTSKNYKIHHKVFLRKFNF
jgi:hypothetical protein